MDGDGSQATQNVLDPRRLGKQNTGFSDEDISDIICVLYPHTNSARQEVSRLAQEKSPYIIGKNEADEVQPDYELEDHASRFISDTGRHPGNHAIILRLSSQVKNPASGFVFGRNSARCDVVFLNDPLRRVSNVHFRIYVNEYGNVMIEDQSTNGTFVDRQLLTRNPEDNSRQPANKWVLSSGSLVKILLHTERQDLIFLVRIPRRDDDFDRAYLARVEEYFTRHNLRPKGGDAPRQDLGGTGTVDIFKVPGGPMTRKAGFEASPPPHPSPSRGQAAKANTHSEWKGSGKYNRTGKIGQGAFAVVYKVTSKYDGLPYAAKEIEKRRFIKNGVLDQKVENEMKIMQRVQHPNIVRYIENFDWEDRLLIIIMEYVPHGDLGRSVSPPGPGPLNVEMTQSIAAQLLSALGYLHANNITHRDVKPDNILINSFDPLVVKLTDFGLSKMVETAETFLRTFCGTLLYCAPEVYTEYAEYDDNGIRMRGQKMRRVPGQRYSHAVDIWSLGGVLFFCLAAAPPYPVKSGISYTELLHKIMTRSLDVTPLQGTGISDAGIDFIQRMLERRPEHRATIAELEAHPWLAGLGSTIKSSQTYDAITDDDETHPSRLQPATDADDRVSDSTSDVSGNVPYADDSRVARRNQPAPRLFGEIDASAIGSSGVIPADFLNLSPASASTGATEMLHYREEVAYDSGDSDTCQGPVWREHGRNLASTHLNQALDQQQSLVQDLASQSLGGGKNDASTAQAKSASQHVLYNMDPNSSKRKPPVHDSSEDADEHRPPGKPVMKRLRSESTLEDVPEEVLEEYKLLARMPQVMTLESGRLIDLPVSKMEFWEQDKNTWHLHYPEMTQLQHDAFKQAAIDGGEEFWPGKTPLWSLAMKYFPPSSGLDNGSNGSNGSHGPSATGEAADEVMVDFPPTAAPVESRQPPDSCQPDTRIIVPVQDDLSTNRVVALVDTDETSCIQHISLSVTDTLLSFGRGPDNTDVYPDKQESRVPKYAFKMMLWKDGQDQPKTSSRGERPWCSRDLSKTDSSSYHFWISTKATLGIKINGYLLASSDAKNPNSPSRYWAKIYNGDSLMIWGGKDPNFQTKLVFRCLWGGSSGPRPADGLKMELASPQTAAKLDSACQRTERRIRQAAEKRHEASKAKAQWAERRSLVERERQRSRIFEDKRLEAVAYMAARQALHSRRGSSASAPAPSRATTPHVALHSVPHSS